MAGSRPAPCRRSGANGDCSPVFIGTRSIGCARKLNPSARVISCAFYFRWQHVSGETRMEGPDALDAIVAQLAGFEAAAAPGNLEILPSRISEYEPAWLDDRCLAGQITWTRLSPPAKRAEFRLTPIRTTPIALLPRRHAQLWKSMSPGETPIVSAPAQAVLTYIPTRRRLRRVGRRLRHPAGAGRKRARGIGCAGSACVGQFCGIARTVDAFGRAETHSGTRPPPRSKNRDRGCWPLGDCETPGCVCCKSARCRGACGKNVASPLWRGVLAHSRAGSIMVAAMARAPARFPEARGPRRDLRRPLHRRIFR